MGGPEKITFNGGKTLRHMADAIYILKSLSNYKLSYSPTQVKCEKARSSRMGLQLDMPLHKETGYGVNTKLDLIRIAIDHGIVVVGGGGWTSWKDIREHGLDNFFEVVGNNPELMKELAKQVYDDIIMCTDIVGESRSEAPLMEVDMGEGEEEPKEIVNA